MAIELDKAVLESPSGYEEAAVATQSSGKPATSALARLNGITLFESKRVSLDDLALFAEQLSLLLETGSALVPAIGALLGQIESKALRRVLSQVHSRLEEGADFSDCLRQHPQVFDSLFISLVKAGEASGALQESLDRIVGILAVRRRLRAHVREATTYPCVLLAVMTGTMIFLLAFVVPRFETMFAGLGDELPGSTKLILGLTHFLHSSGWVLLPITAVIILGGRWLLKTTTVRNNWDLLKMRVPTLGPLFARSYLHQLFLSLGLLLRSRVPLMEAIGIAQQIVDNAQYRTFFDQLTKHVEDGHGVAQCFREAKFLPETVKLMISTGEESGALDRVMAKLAEHYQKELESSIKRVSVMLEPVMLVVMGGMVGFIASSFILPIFKMSQTIH